MLTIFLLKRFRKIDAISSKLPRWLQKSELPCKFLGITDPIYYIRFLCAAIVSFVIVIFYSINDKLIKELVEHFISRLSILHYKLALPLNTASVFLIMFSSTDVI